MIAMPASDFCPASELPASPSREAQLEDLVRTQALALERLEAMLDGPQQAPGGKLSGPEKAAIIQALSTLEGRIKALEKATEHLDDLKKDLNTAACQIEDVHSLTRERLNNFAKRLTDLEHQSKPKETETVKAHVEAIYQELLRRQKAGQKGITYKDAARLLKRNKARISQLRPFIAADPRFDLIWHPTKKNAKLICLHKYK